MKVISFKVNNVSGRVHVPVLEMVIPKLISDKIITSEDDLVEVDWSGMGKYSVVFTKKQYIICPYCQSSNSLAVEDLGFEEFECGSCDSMFSIPETISEIAQFNKDSFNNSHTMPPTHYRVMLRGEDGTESCLKNNIPVEYASLVCEGFQSHYSEGQTCWLEAEATPLDLRRMCDDNSGDRYEF